MEKAIVTKIGREKLCKAHAGDITLPKITHMAFGDGGISDENIELKPTGSETALYNELLKKELDGHSYPDSDNLTTCRYTATLGIGECTGKYISEIGLYDEEGDLIALRTFLPMGKTEDIPLSFDMDEVF
jgi:Phage-related tail fibre protein